MRLDRRFGRVRLVNLLRLGLVTVGLARVGVVGWSGKIRSGKVGSCKVRSGNFGSSKVRPDKVGSS